MSYRIGIITLGSTGSKTVNLGISSAPTSVSFIVQNKAGTAESVKHVSIGSATTNGQRTTSYFKDTGSPSVYDVTNKCISHYDRVNGSIIEVLSASFVSFTNNGFTINVTKANVDYDVYIRADY